MTQEELQEEAGILDLACVQLGRELAEGRLQMLKHVAVRLGVLVRKLEKLEKLAVEVKPEPAISEKLGA